MSDFAKSLFLYLLLWLILTVSVYAQGGGADPPTTQSHTVVFSNVEATKMTVGWTIGNGTNRAVFILKSSSGSASPSNNTTYTADTEFKQGTQIDSTGWYCVYNGPGASATVTGLMPDTIYRAMVCEYSGTPGNEKYLTITASGNPDNQTMEKILINEVDADTPGSDKAEFIELYDGGAGNVSLDGLVIVFYNGSNDQSYAVHDLDSLSTNGSGYFVLGNAGVSGVDKTFSNGSLQNGADAVALFLGDALDFPSGTALTTINLVDALVYDTGDADDAGLLVLISSGGQIDEKGKGDSGAHSNQRIPNGSGGQRNTSSYDQAPPTPGGTNDTYPTITSAEYDVNTGNLVVTGSKFVAKAGADNDIDAAKFTITGEGDNSYTLINTNDVDISSETQFTLTLDLTDKDTVNLLLNKSGISSKDNTSYNLAGAEDWAVGADTTVNVADTAGNGITVINAERPPASADNTIATNEDIQYIFAESDFPFNDPNDDDFAGIKITSVGSYGDLEYNNNDVTAETDYADVSLLVFTPAADENGSPYTTFNFKVKDNSGAYSVDSYTMTINVNPVNDAPLLYNIEPVPLSFTENGLPAVVTARIKVKDKDDVNMHGARISITDNYQPGEDILSLEPDGYSGVSGSWDESTGILTLTGIGSRLTYQRNLRKVVYNNININDPSTLIRTLIFQVSDESLRSNKISRDINIITLNDPPVLEAIEQSTLVFTEGDPPLQVTGSISLTDVDNDYINSAYVQIVENYKLGEDVLNFSNTAAIAGGFNAGDATLTLTGSDTKGNYQNALRSIEYLNTNTDNPSTLTRTVSFMVDDGEDESNLLTRNIDVSAVNDPPVIDTSGVDTTPQIVGNDSLKILLNVNDENEDSLKYSAECSSDSIHAEIVFNSPASLLIVPLFNADISATILVIVSDGFSADTLTFYVEITEKNYSPALTGFNNYTINEGGQFDIISLDDFVNDENDNNNELVWTIKGNTDLVFDINDNRILSIGIPGPDWYGEETISLKVEDPDGLADSASVTFKVLAVNDPPVFVAGGIPDVEFNEDTEITIALGQYVFDCDNDSSEIEFDVSLTNVINARSPLFSDLETANDDLIINLDNENKTVTFSALKDSTGKFLVVITASDYFSEIEDTIEVTVLPVNDAPVIFDIPDIEFPEDSSFTLDLNPFVFDIDNNIEEITWAASIDADSLNIEIDEETHTLSVSAAKNFNGLEIPLILQASDGELSSNPDTITISVIARNDPPVISKIPELIFNEDDTLTVPFDMWQSYVSDPETPNDELMYFFTKGKEVSLELIGPVAGFNLFADENWFGIDTLTFNVSDEDTTVSKDIFVNVLSVNDMPEFDNLPDTLYCDGDSTIINLRDLINDIESPSEAITFSFDGFNDELLFLSFDSTNGNLIVSVVNGFNDNVIINITAEDGDGGTVEAELTFKPCLTTGLGELALKIPEDYMVEQNYPNPFNPSTTIRFGLPSESTVNIAIYNMLGELVSVLVDEVKPAGYFEYRWNATGLASGVYIYSIYAEATDRTTRFSKVKKMVLLR